MERAREWLETGRYEAAVAEADGEPIGYVVWRRDPDYGDVDVPAFLVAGQAGGVRGSFALCREPAAQVRFFGMGEISAASSTLYI